jgi:hypothetical protein
LDRGDPIQEGRNAVVFPGASSHDFGLGEIAELRPDERNLDPLKRLQKLRRGPFKVAAGAVLSERAVVGMVM